MDAIMLLAALVGLIVGVLVGQAMAMALLLFFEPQIYAFLDWCAEWFVRRD